MLMRKMEQTIATSTVSHLSPREELLNLVHNAPGLLPRDLGHPRAASANAFFPPFLTATILRHGTSMFQRVITLIPIRAKIASNGPVHREVLPLPAAKLAKGLPLAIGPRTRPRSP